jgi:hypothetical protein
MMAIAIFFSNFYSLTIAFFFDSTSLTTLGNIIILPFHPFVLAQALDPGNYSSFKTALAMAGFQGKTSLRFFYMKLTVNLHSLPSLYPRQP